MIPTMSKTAQSVARPHRSLLSFSDREISKLLREAQVKGLRLATYLRHLVVTHPERAGGASNR